MRRRRPRGEGELLLHGGGAAVALCRDRAPLLADAIRHRYALADAHRAYAASLRDAAAALHDFLRGVQTTFVLRLTSVLGARTAATAAAPPWGGNPDSTLVADVEREMVGVEAGEVGHAVGDVGGDDAAAE
uniref:DUF630 domain-containing protein n=1 Tax=Oryza rufipogon TaxID=4529 RepID=A0A0E0QU17_ORYRU